MGAYCFECMSEFQANLRECPNCHARIPYYSTDARDCPAGTVLRNRYLIGKALGRGGFGVSYIAMDLTTRQRVCIKECNVKDRTYRDPYNPVSLLPKEDGESQEEFEKFKQSLLQEGESLVRLRGIPEVVLCQDSFACNNTSYVVMEYLEGRDLKHYVREERGSRNPLSIDEAVYYTILLLNALAKVHKHHILHRDISPDNIYLLNNGALKLIDFGSARKLSSGSMTGFHKPGYTAPEMLAGDKEGPYTDIYSAGAVLYFLLTGKKPEKPVDGGQLTPPPPDRSTPELTAIFNKAVQRKPQNRYQSAEDMARDLNAFLQKRTGVSADTNTHTHTHTHTHSHTRTRTHTVTGPQRKTGLMMGIIGAVLALLIAVMVIASSSGPKAPASMPAAVVTAPPTATPTPAPQTPAVVESVSDGESAVSDAETAPPTTKPKPELHDQLLTRPANAYTLMNGSSVDIPLSYGEKGAFDLDLWYDQNKLRIEMPSAELMRVTALGSGEASVSYFDGERQRSFTVYVVDMPNVQMLTAENEARMFSSTRSGFLLFLPKGDQVQLQAVGLTEYTLQADTSADAPVALAFEKTEQGHVITVDALREGEQTVAIRSGSMELFQLAVTVTPHAVISELQDEYHLYENSTLPLVFTFSDGALISPERDVDCSSDCLRINADAREPETLYFTAVKPGVADVSVSGRMFRITVHPLPRLTGTGVKSNRSGDTFTLEIPQDAPFSLTLTGVDAQLPVAITAQQDGAPALTLDGNALSIAASRQTGHFSYVCTSGEHQLFTLNLSVIERGVASDFKQTYTMLQGTEMTLPLTFSNGVAFTPSVASSDEAVASAAFTEQGIVLKAVSAGSASITVDGKSFTVSVLPGATLTDIHGNGLAYRDGVYVLNMRDNQTLQLNIQRGTQDYAIVSDHSGDNACSVALQNEELRIAGIGEGSTTFTFRSEGADANAVLFTLQVNVAFQPQLTNQFKDQYTLIQGRTLAIPLTFRNDQRYVPQVKATSKLLQVEANEEALTLHAVKAGFTSFTVDGQRLAVTILPTVTLEAPQGVDLTQNGPAHYTLNISDTDHVFLSSPGLSKLPDTELTMPDLDVCSIPSFGEQIEVYGHGEGSSSFVIYCPDVDTDGEVLRLDVNVGFAQQLTTGFKESYTLLAGSTLEIPLSFRNDQRFTPEVNVSGKCVRAGATDSALTIEANTQGKASVTVDGKTFTVAVLSPATLADSSVLARADAASGQYAVSMKDTDSLTLEMENLSDSYSVVLERIGDDVFDASVDGSTLTLTGKRTGSCTLVVRAQGIDADAQMFRLNVEVTLAQQLTTAFKDVYTVLENTELTIPLTFRGNQRFVPEATSSDEGIADVSVSGETLTLIGRQRGSTVVTVDGRTFTVEVLPRIRLLSESVIPDENGNYTLHLPQNTLYTITASHADPGYTVDISGSRAGEEFLKLSGKTQLTVDSRTCGEFTYTLYARNEDFTQKLFTLTLIVSEPRMSTVFDFSYTMMLGESCAIPLRFENGRPEVTASSKTLDVSIQENELHLYAGKTGQHTVKVTAGSDTQTFYVQVNQPTGLFLTDGHPLAQNNEGQYLLTVPARKEQIIQAQGYNLTGSLSVLSEGYAIDHMHGSFDAYGNGEIIIGAGDVSEEDAFVHLVCSPHHDNMISRSDYVHLATLRLSVGMEWRISAETVMTLEDDPAQVMLEICTALKSLDLLKGDAAAQAQRAIDADGSLRDTIWQMMLKVKQQNSGFSDEAHYTREDYQRLLTLAAEFEAFRQAQAAATPTPVPLQSNEKNFFSITDAAALGSTLYLMDKDTNASGQSKEKNDYLIVYDSDTQTSQSVNKDKYDLVSGNGSAVLLALGNGTFELQGDFSGDIAALLLDNADRVDAVAMAADSVLLVLDRDGMFSLVGDKKLDPRQEDLYLSGGQAFYVWYDGKNTKAMGVSVEKETTAAENISLSAAGDHTIAFLTQDEDGEQILYAKTTARNTGLGKKVTNLNKNSRLFAQVKASMPDKQPLDVVDLSVSDDNLAIVQRDGTVYVMGDNSQYQFGVGNDKDLKNFQQVMERENRPLSGISQVALMNGYTLMLDRSGHVWICGNCGGMIYTYAKRLPDLSDVAGLIRLDPTRALLLDQSGQILMLDYDQPLNYDPTFITVQR